MNRLPNNQVLPQAIDPADGVGPCWSCKGPVTCDSTFCSVCGAVQPPGQIDHFARLGLPVTFDIDTGALDRGYFSLQRSLHPDRFATHTPCERMLSQQQATSLNEAYEILRDPLSRAVYMTGMAGRDVLAAGETLSADTDLLMESMERREALSEAESEEQIAAIANETAVQLDDCVAALSTAFAADDMDGACRLTTRLKYLRKLADEVRARKSAVAGA